jgi:hypothetical protein
MGNPLPCAASACSIKTDPAPNTLAAAVARVEPCKKERRDNRSTAATRVPTDFLRTMAEHGPHAHDRWQCVDAAIRLRPRLRRSLSAAPGSWQTRTTLYSSPTTH